MTRNVPQRPPNFIDVCAHTAPSSFARCEVCAFVNYAPYESSRRWTLSSSTNTRRDSSWHARPHRRLGSRCILPTPRHVQTFRCPEASRLQRSLWLVSRSRRNAVALRETRRHTRDGMSLIQSLVITIQAPSFHKWADSKDACVARGCVACRRLRSRAQVRGRLRMKRQTPNGQAYLCLSLPRVDVQLLLAEEGGRRRQAVAKGR